MHQRGSTADSCLCWLGYPGCTQRRSVQSCCTAHPQKAKQVHVPSLWTTRVASADYCTNALPSTAFAGDWVPPARDCIQWDPLGPVLLHLAGSNWCS